MERHQREVARLRTMLAMAAARAGTADLSADEALALSLGPGLAECAGKLQTNWWVRATQRRNLKLIALLLRREGRQGRRRGLSPVELQLLGHALCQVRFGVPANLTWYLHFQDLVQEGLVTEQRLRSALRCDAVKTLDDGRVDLQIQEPKGRIVWLATTCLLFVAAALANLFEPAIGGSTRHDLLTAANLALPAVCLGMWSLGPRRWIAERYLARTGLWDGRQRGWEEEVAH